MQTWLFVLMAVGNEPGDEMHDKVDGNAMVRMLDLRDFLSWSMRDSLTGLSFLECKGEPGDAHFC